MPKLAANLTMLFGELPFLDRFAAAASAGFRGVEYMSPYDHEPQVVAERLEAAGLVQVLHNLPAGNWARGDRGFACHPDRVGEFQDSVGQALTYARALRCTRLNCMAGKAPEGIRPERAEAVLVDNLKFAARELRQAGITLLLEAINTRDMPGFFVSTTSHALRVLDAVGEDHILYQYDIYHMQRMEGELAETLRANLPRIGHIQLADNPGRHEPGTGEINYQYLLPLLDRLGYAGWVGSSTSPPPPPRPAWAGWRPTSSSALGGHFDPEDTVKIGFIGLGIMGRPMAGRLLDGGHQLVVNDLVPIPAALLEQGAQAASSARAVAQAAEVIIVMVPDTPDVAAVLFGKDGVAEGLAPGKIVVDMSSISPVETRASRFV